MHSNTPNNIDLTTEITTLAPGALKVGDVILSTHNHIVSWIIRGLTKSPISHAALHIGGGFILEAVETGVQRVYARCLNWEDSNKVRVLRPISVEESKLEEVSSIARALLYRPYSYRGAIGAIAPLFRRTQDAGRFCSQLVFEAYKLAGISIISDKTDAKEVVPHDFLDSNVLVDVTREVLVNKPAYVYERTTSRLSEALNRRAKSADDIERVLLDKITPIMQAASLEQPFNLYDVLRQITIVLEHEPSIARLMDDLIFKAIQSTGILKEAVPPRPMNPFILDITLSGDWMPVFGLENEEIFLNKIAPEMKYLSNELSLSVKWDWIDWQRDLSEMLRAHQDTKLNTYAAIGYWAAREFKCCHGRPEGICEVPKRYLH
jgi:Orthopoxvirus protein of unknown function (DUF830).